MQFGANNLLNDPSADPVITIGVFAFPSVENLHRRPRRMERHAQRLTQSHSNRQILMHSIYMTARTLKLPVNNLFKRIVYHPTARRRGGKHVEQHLPRHASLCRKSCGFECCRPLRSDQRLQYHVARRP